MDHDRKRPAPVGRVSANTSGRVDQMTEEERTQLAQVLAGRKSGAPDTPGQKGAAIPRKPTRGVAPQPDDDVAATVVRLTAELHRTERRLDRLERSLSHGRYQTGGSGPVTGRHARLLSRADRLDRQLRALR